MLKEAEKYFESVYLDFYNLDKKVGKASINISRKDSVSIWSVEILEEFRNSGLGQQMMLEILEYIKSNYKDINRIWLRVFFQNSRAVHVYEKCGFLFCDSLMDGIREMEINLKLEK